MKYLEKGLEIVKNIEEAGYAAYIVGGAVRDYVLKKEIHDIDIATNLPMEKLYEMYSVIESGINYASVSVESEGFLFEITHFRKDIAYADYRHPEIMLVDSLKEDVKRRDFTVNALAMDGSGQIIDYFNGLGDIQAKLIRMIGDPYIRLKEDALRILRALFFSSKLGFRIEQSTLEAMAEHKRLLSFLSQERIFSYFKKILYAEFSYGMDYIVKYDFFEFIEEYKKWLKIVNKNCNSDDLCIYYYLEYGQYPAVSKSEDKKHCLIVKNIIENHFSNYILYRYQKEIPGFFHLFFTLGYDTAEIAERLNQLKIKSDRELDLSKEDISKLFHGKMISIAIEEVIKAILDGRIDNDKKSILIFLKGLDVVEC